MFKKLNLEDLKIQIPALYPSKVEKPSLVSFSNGKFHPTCWV